MNELLVKNPLLDVDFVKNKTKQIMLLIPAFNEEKNIDALMKQLYSLPIINLMDIVIINDASSDNTKNIAESYDCTVISHMYNMGYGMALQTGYKYAVKHNYQYIIQIDADLQHDVSNILKIYNEFQNDDDLDLVLGSRFFKDSSTFQISIIKKISIKLFGYIVKIASGKEITDPTSGLQGLSRKLFCFYANFGNFDSDYPDANMLIQIINKGFKVSEFAAVMHKRTFGTSMHAGIIKPILYMIRMTLSLIIVSIRSKLNENN